MSGKHSKASKIQQFRTYWNTENTPKSNTPKAVLKFRHHIIFITIGIAFAIGSTYVTSLSVHITIALPVLPSIAQEVFDRIRSL